MNLLKSWKKSYRQRSANANLYCWTDRNTDKKNEQVGTYHFQNAYNLAAMAKKYGVGLKEHNADYLDDVTLLEHIPANVTASNVAPQYGTEETRAYLKLCDVEDILKRKG